MTQPVRVLIADDSERARSGLRALLTTRPEVQVVGEASNGREAVELVAERRPTIVLMDLQMPIMDGVEATQLIKRRSPDISVIIVTLHPLQETVALAAGADAFIVKGDAPERLLGALAACVAAKA